MSRINDVDRLITFTISHNFLFVNLEMTTGSIECKSLRQKNGDFPKAFTVEPLQTIYHYTPKLNTCTRIILSHTHSHEIFLFNSLNLLATKLMFTRQHHFSNDYRCPSYKRIKGMQAAIVLQCSICQTYKATSVGRKPFLQI